MTLIVPAVEVTLSLLWSTTVGWPTLRRWQHDCLPAKQVGWGIAMGLLTRSSLYLLALRVHVSPSPAALLGGEMLLLVGALFIRSSPKTTPLPHFAGLGAHILFALAILIVLANGWRFVSRPLWTTDYLAIWGLKAKTIFFSHSIPDRVFHDAGTQWSHPEYPLLVPLSLASLAASIARFDDRALGILYVAVELATISIIFGYLRRSTGALLGATGALLTALFFPLYQPVNAGTGEIPLALGFLLLGTAYLDSLEPGRENAPLVRLAIASLYCAATKQEGALFVVVLAASLAISSLRRKPRTLLPRDLLKCELVLLLPLVAHAALLRMMRGSVTRRAFDLSLIRPGRWPEWWQRIAQTLSHIARIEVPQTSVAIGALLTLLLLTKAGRSGILLGSVLAQIAVYIVIMSLSALGVDWLISASFGRLVETLVPLILLITVERLGSFQSLRPQAARALC